MDVKKELSSETRSLAAGVTRILSFMLLAGALILTALLVMTGYRISLSMPNGLWYLMDEMDDELISAFLLWCGFILSFYLSIKLKKAR